MLWLDALAVGRPVTEIKAIQATGKLTCLLVRYGLPGSKIYHIILNIIDAIVSRARVLMDLTHHWFFNTCDPECALKSGCVKYIYDTRRYVTFGLQM